MARITLTSYMAANDARMDRIEASLESLVAAQLTGKARNRKAEPKAPATKKAQVTKGAQTRETLSRKDWNRTLTAKARLAGKYDCGTSVYAYVLANWDEAQVAREAGMTPDEFLAQF